MFGTRVRQFRERLGLTQAVLAQRLTAAGLKLDHSAVARLEKGKRAIRLDEAVTLANVLNSTVNEMIAVASLEEEVRRLQAYRDDLFLIAANAGAEHQAVTEKLHHMQERLGDKAGEDHGQHQAET